jgi:hypothetical protein
LCLFFATFDPCFLALDVVLDRVCNSGCEQLSLIAFLPIAEFSDRKIRKDRYHRENHHKHSGRDESGPRMQFDRG